MYLFLISAYELCIFFVYHSVSFQIAELSSYRVCIKGLKLRRTFDWTGKWSGATPVTRPCEPRHQGTQDGVDESAGVHKVTFVYHSALLLHPIAPTPTHTPTHKHTETRGREGEVKYENMKIYQGAGYTRTTSSALAPPG